MSPSPEPRADFLPLNGTDYVEFYVGNARQAAYYYRAAFGFRLTAYRGPENGTRLRRQGVDFLRIPHSYYRDLTARVGAIDEPLEELEELGILGDRDEEGYLLQLFTKPRDRVGNGGHRLKRLHDLFNGFC